MAGAVEIRPVTALAEFDRCVEVETAVWGYDPTDTIPRRMFLLASRIGGQVLGAYVGGEAEDGVGGRRGEQMVGFAMALPGYRDGEPYLHSHMLGVLPAYRNLRLGQRLKLAQREDALRRGFALMEWTFDPLEIRNAYLNIAKLGAVVRRYQRDFYGPSSSPLQGGLPTDRVYAEWSMGSERVRRVLAGEAPVIEVVRTVEVPAAVAAWKASAGAASAGEREAARAVQARNAGELEAGFARGEAVLGYERGEDGGGRFLLGRWEGAGL